MAGCEAARGLPEDWDPRTRILVSYWDGLRSEGGLPGRRHIDPVDIPVSLANIWLIDVQCKPLRFRFRLVGTRVADFLGRDPTGLWIDEAYPSFPGSEIEADFAACVKQGEPRWRRGPPFMEANKEYAQVERIALPLAANGRDTDMLLCLSLYERWLG
jgi:hypothetical protein